MKIVVEISQDEALKQWLRNEYPDHPDYGKQPEWEFQTQDGGVPMGLRAVKEVKRG
jgi:hypothetical protein